MIHHLSTAASTSATFSIKPTIVASCLRDRLFVLIAAQVEENRRKTEDRRKSDAHNQPPLLFPRSVSPYICRRSDDSSWHNNDRRFYSTPQIGPTFSSFNDNSTTKKHSSSKFSLLKILFRSSRSEVSDISDPTVSNGSSPISTSSSSSWFSVTFFEISNFGILTSFPYF
ncbi:hypothetical protein ACHQM5_018787 [Ranunculus cassubicifolius]